MFYPLAAPVNIEFERLSMTDPDQHLASQTNAQYYCLVTPYCLIV